jgi:hypothetical protein
MTAPELRSYPLPNITTGNRTGSFRGPGRSRLPMEDIHVCNTKMPKADRIRALNDQLRRDLTTGRALITPGIAALGPVTVARIIKTVAVFDDFCDANDPYCEHDFGSFEVEGRQIFFKIDYFDETLTYHSPDPADPAVTTRVITIMLAEEY